MLCDMISKITNGLLVEPSLTPKPGAVTPEKRHKDKNYYDFLIHSNIVQKVMYETCKRYEKEEKNIIAYGFKLYRKFLIENNIGKNIALGEFLLHLPFSIAIYYGQNSYEIAKASSEIIRNTGREEGIEYYEILKGLSLSYLGKYQGLEKDVNEGYPNSFIDVLEKYSWDLVYKELLNNYSISLEIKEKMEKINEEKLNEKFLWGFIHLISSYGDTLIAKKNGFNAFIKTRNDAEIAKIIAKKYGIKFALDYLDKLWRPLKINPGSSLDVLSSSITFYFLDNF
ncbi:MAG: triphosphoribosyl-dephospho-CoA synthase [Caldisphaera sp.]